MQTIQALEALITATQARIKTARAAGNAQAVAQATETLNSLYTQRNTLRAQISA